MLHTKEQADALIPLLIRHVGKTAVVVSCKKVFDYNYDLAKEFVPAHLHWEPGMILDDGYEVTIEDVTYHEVNLSGSYHVSCVVSYMGQAYLYMWEGLKLKEETTL